MTASRSGTLANQVGSRDHRPARMPLSGYGSQETRDAFDSRSANETVRVGPVKRPVALATAWAGSSGESGMLYG